ncbi:MAG TPA: outer membrane beta-barrel protein [Chitinophagaceae bacterium]|nr:outer membrane beta-barrel protein [Chitinophagaceae bacterium]
MPTLVRVLLPVLMILALLNATQAQTPETRVSFRIQTGKNQPLSFASVTVIPVPDSTKAHQQVADTTGLVMFTLQQGGQYIVRISSINYEPIEKRITVKGTDPVFTFTAQESSNTLGNVVVTAKRPLMRQEDDKTIVDPENLAASSTNAYEIIEKTPGLFVDQDGNIYLNSTTPATIYINGREQKMSTADIATMLKSLPPNSIASIEILRTPSARYDASGSGGIVNVILKKGVKIGLTGSINAGFNQGVYNNRFAGININNNNGKLTTYLNLQISQRNTYEQIKTDRIFAPDSLLSQDAFTRYPTNSYYTGFGANYQLSDKWEISYDGRLSLNVARNRTINGSEISKISTGELVTSNEALVQNKARSYNINQGISAKYKMDSLGSEWTSDISYTYAPNNSNQLFNTVFYAPQIPSSGGDGDIKNRLQFFSAQTNIIKKFPKNYTLEGGLKTTNVWFTNETDYFRETGGSRVKDAFRTRSYRYTENIHSAYVQGSKNISGFIVKAGVRMENTNMKGRQLIPADTSFTQHRTDLFPYIYLSKGLMKIAGYELRAYLVFRRTISRPAYEYLNPFPRYIDQYLYETGNPSLRPQFTKNYEANISVDERPILAVGFNDTKDIFTQVIYQADSTRSLAYRTYDNLGSNKELYFRGLGAIPPGGKYFFVLGAQYNHNFYQGLYENAPLSFKRGSWTFFTYHQLKITPLTQVTLNGFVRFNGQLQFYELSSFGSLNFSISQQFLKKKLTVTLSGHDVFFTNNNRFTIKQGSVDASGFREGDTKRFGLNVRYNFGFRKREENNNMFNVESGG